MRTARTSTHATTRLHAVVYPHPCRASVRCESPIVCSASSHSFTSLAKHCRSRHFAAALVVSCKPMTVGRQNLTSLYIYIYMYVLESVSITAPAHTHTPACCRSRRAACAQQVFWPYIRNEIRISRPAPRCTAWFVARTARTSPQNVAAYAVHAYFSSPIIAHC